MEFFSAASQEYFEAVVEEQITTYQPWKMIDKAMILAEAKKKGAISDWFPFCKVIEKIKEEEVMLIWCEELEPELQYAEEWYFASTTQSRALMLKTLEERQEKMKPAAPAGAAAAAEGGEAGEGAVEEEEEDEEYEIPEVHEGPLFAKPEGEYEDKGTGPAMEELKVKSTRPLFCLEFSRVRREFGQPIKFNFHDADIDDMHAEVVQAKVKKQTAKEASEAEPEKIVPREQMEFSFQVTKKKVDACTQTFFSETSNVGVLYDPIEMEKEKATEQLQTPNMSDFLKAVWPRYEVALLMNACADIYEDDLSALVDGEDQMQGNSKGDQIKEAYSFQDLLFSKNKQIVCIDWHEPGKGVLGCAYVQKQDFQARVDKIGLVAPAVVLVWDFADNINPQYVLEGPSDMFCFRFNPTDPDWVAAGCISGQVLLWNLKTGHKAPTTFAEQLAMEKPEGNKTIMVEFTDFSPSLCETSHRRPVTDLCWLPAELEFGTDGSITRGAEEGAQTKQFATVSGDGMILIWDLRVKKDTRRPDKEPIWNPTFKFQLKDLSGELHGGCQLNVVDTGDGAKFVVTSESGELVTGHWKKTKGEEAALEDEEADTGPFVQSVAPGHFGSCQTLQVSPFFPDIWLTVGDWRFSIWKDGVDQPIFSSPFQPCRVTCARWSPNRPSVVFVGREDGVMDVWDFLDRSHEALTNYMFTQPIVSMEFPKGKVSTGTDKKEAGHFLGVGDDIGMCHVMKLPRMLTRPSRIEEKTIKAIFDREVARVDYIKRRTEFREEERSKLESQAGAEDDAGPDPAQVAKELEEAEKQFQKLKEQFDKDMGLNQPEEEEEN